MTILVAIGGGWDQDQWVERFRAALPGREIVTPGEPFDRRSVNYAMTWYHPPGTLAGLPNLEVIFSLGAGVDHVLSDPRLPEDAVVARVVDPNLTQRMSEYVVMHCLMHLRQQRRYEAQQRAKLWDDDRHQPPAEAIRVGIMGLGVLGQDAARKLSIMGFDVAGWSRVPRAVHGIESFAGEAELTAFLARTDILVVLLPLTPETRGIVNGRLLAGLAQDGKLAEGPVLINAGRGGLQVEADILSCLGDGTLGAATLDVFETEPLPPGSPLWTHPRVTVTPHNAGMSEPEAICRLIARQIRRIEKGKRLENVVDRARGY
jgi:glyoxylate/hydroxypyruvate reductase A